MLLLFRQMFFYQLRIYYPRWYYFPIMLAGACVSILVYFFTSKAIGAQLNSEMNWHGMDYFNYLVLGELAILPITSAMDSFPRAIQKIMHLGLAPDVLRASNIQALKRVLRLSLGLMFNDILYWLVIYFVAVIGFGFNLSGDALLPVLVLLLMAIPGFYFTGVLAGSFLFVSGRGRNLMNQLSYYFAVLSGVYFPVAAFGELQNYLKIFLPHTFYMENIRRAAELTGAMDWVNSTLYFTAFTCLAGVAAFVSFKVALSKSRILGVPELRLL